MILFLVKYVQNWFGLFCHCFSAFMFLSLSSVPVAHTYTRKYGALDGQYLAQVNPKLRLNTAVSCWMKPKLCHGTCCTMAHFLPCRWLYVRVNVLSLVMFIPKAEKRLLSKRNWHNIIQTLDCAWAPFVSCNCMTLGEQKEGICGCFWKKRNYMCD